MNDTKVDYDRVKRALDTIDDAIARCVNRDQLFARCTVESLTSSTAPLLVLLPVRHGKAD